VSEERINKVAETYRVLRNALRYQISNLYDFDPAKHTVPDDSLTSLDRWILDDFAGMEKDVLLAYDRSEFHVVYQRVSQFVAVELSAIYHDAVKDRLYTDAANSPRRRSTQTALHRMLIGLCKMLGPVLAFTTDEAWEFVPGKTVDSAHLLTWQPTEFTVGAAERQVWKNLFEIRGLALPALEKARQAKQIGKALEAKLVLARAESALANAQVHSESLRELLNVSQLELSPGTEERLAVSITKAAGQKCERCWHWESDIGSNPEHPTICGRCVKAVQAVTNA